MEKQNHSHSLLFNNNDTTPGKYYNLCNHPPYKQFIERLWKDFRLYADKQFEKEFKTETFARFWEMYLGCSLLYNGFKLEEKNKAEGPDLHLIKDNNIIYIEAVTPDKGSGRDKLNEPPKNKEYKVSVETVILRVLNSLDNKKKQYIKWVQNKVIDNSNPYISAINGSQTVSPIIEDDIPFILRAISTFGNEYDTFDVNTNEFVDSGYVYESTVTKTFGEKVTKDIISQKEYSFISGFLYSNVSPLNRPKNMTDDFIFIHNPIAINPLPIGFLKLGKEIYLSENEFKVNDYRIDIADIFL